MNVIKVLRFIKVLFRPLLVVWCKPVIDIWFGGFWKYKEYVQRHHSKLGMVLYNDYCAKYGAWIGVESVIDGEPVCPHGLFGIFISKGARIGRDCVIFQQVTIGSVTTKESKHLGSPIIGHDVYIGAGAKIVGNVKVGDNCRIGANCVIAKDIPANSIVYNSGISIDIKNNSLDNTFYKR